MNITHRTARPNRTAATPTPATRRPISRRALASVVTVAAAGAAMAAIAPAAWAYGPSYCNSSTCDLSNTSNTGGIYFEMPRSTPVSMICWTDTQWYDGTNRWFRVNTVYGQGYMIATQVAHQTTVGHC